MVKANTQKIARQEFDRVLDHLKLKDWTGKEHSLLPQMVFFSFEEEIFQTTIHGTLKVLDSVDYPTLLPLIGEERIIGSFTRNEAAKKSNLFLGGRLPAIKFDMQVYRMDGKLQVGGSRKSQEYFLRYISDLSLINIGTRVYANFENMKYSDMVKKIYETYIKRDGDKYKPLNVEETEGAFDYYIQNLSPINAITKLAQRATSAEGNGNFYVFYEDRDAYNFVSFGKLFRQTPLITLSCEVKNILKQDSGGSKTVDLETQLYNTSNYARNENFDVIQSALSGESSSSLLSVDPLTRQYYLTEFDLRGKDRQGKLNWGKYPKLAIKKPWTDSNPMFIDPKANMAMLVTDLNQDVHEYISDKTKVRPFLPEDFFLSRLSQKQQFMRNVVRLSVTGDPRVKPGVVVKFDIPEILGKTGTKSPEMPDKWLRGNFLVISALHSVTQSEYTMYLELVKDGFETEISKDTYRTPSKVYKGYENV